jgi:hypothetical protein
MNFAARQQIGLSSPHTIRNSLKSLVVGLAFVAWLGATGIAQNKSNEVGLLLGGSIVPTSTTGFNISSGWPFKRPMRTGSLLTGLSDGASRCPSLPCPARMSSLPHRVRRATTRQYSLPPASE